MSHELSAINLGQIGEAIMAGTKPVSILWQEEDTIAFVARNRPYRSEFHVDPSDEVLYMLKGDTELHYLTPEGERKVATIREGELFRIPAGTPHSPHGSPDSYGLVLERRRRPDEQDRFLWFCERCNTKLYEATRHVADYREDPVSRAYEEFYADPSHLTCRACGHVMAPMAR